MAATCSFDKELSGGGSYKKLEGHRKTDLFASSVLVAEYRKRGKNIPFINMSIKWMGGGKCP